MKRKSHIGLFLKFIPLILIVVSVFIGIWQIKKIREFFGQASGEPANFVVDTQAILGPMPRPWRNLAQGGEQFNWRMTPISGQVKALHPNYIRLDHIYDFYDIVKGTPGNLTFDFTKFDAILDDIKATGAKPYIALSYMPPAISSGDILAKPQRWSDWQLVVQKTIEHVSGTRRTPDVYYEVWNEPDLFGGWKYYGNKNYLDLYSNAVQGANNARGVLPFKIGGPAITALYESWFKALAKYSIDNNLRLDFFSWHRYTNNLDQYKKDMFDVQTWVKDFPQLEPTLEFHITEWGHDSNNNTGYDTSYGAAHTVAGAIQMTSIIDKAFVFEIQDGQDPKGKDYWGRWGLFNYKSQPKPRYNALRMLDQIGNQRLSLFGQGSWVKGLAAIADDGNPEVILANFDQYSSHSENVPITFQNIEPGTYTLSEKFLGGRQQSQSIATDSAALQVYVAMPVNSVSTVELIKTSNVTPNVAPPSTTQSNSSDVTITIDQAQGSAPQ